MVRRNHLVLAHLPLSFTFARPKMFSPRQAHPWILLFTRMPHSKWTGKPLPSTADAEGQRLFAANCGFCHGSDARGGAEGGPNLTRSAIATGDRQQFATFLKAGRPPRMPAFDLPGLPGCKPLRFHQRPNGRCPRIRSFRS